MRKKGPLRFLLDCFSNIKALFDLHHLLSLNTHNKRDFPKQQYGLLRLTELVQPIY